MNSPDKPAKGSSSSRFWVAVLFFSLVALCGTLTVANAQTPYTLKFNRVRVFNSLNENGTVTRERYDSTGGIVEINVDGKAYGFCPGGSEKLRFSWSFIDGDISRVPSSSNLTARLEISQIVRNQPCTTSYLDRTEFWIQGSNGTASPFTADESKRIGSDIFYEHARIMGASSKTLGIKTADKAQSETDIAWFEINIGTSAGYVRYVYLFDVVKGGNSGNQTDDISISDISGNWESDYSGSWKPATIRQRGKTLWFTNEFNDTSEGVFESSARVKATKWQVGAVIQDKNTIKWDNGTTWRRRN